MLVLNDFVIDNTSVYDILILNSEIECTKKVLRYIWRKHSCYTICGQIAASFFTIFSFIKS